MSWFEASVRDLREPAAARVSLAEYIIFFVLVMSTGAGVPGPGDAAMIAAGTLAGEGGLNIGVVLVTSDSGLDARFADRI